ncbi:hypothetical protein HELRODRAFT_182911 [Helobdella robusta]|uniref:Uncharacterized protein n=1 Tax=Helobdella robusta TaxID=6412 RepID=T1FIX2_HELRO|nr:hypothetical protein HELRODRAFT_182911 [Helobdella robusta]ESN90008.1 hypothetical protein HELRODRAFT_182911 [Helobdella robusta]
MPEKIVILITMTSLYSGSNIFASPSSRKFNPSSYAIMNGRSAPAKPTYYDLIDDGNVENLALNRPPYNSVQSDAAGLWDVIVPTSMPVFRPSPSKIGKVKKSETDEKNWNVHFPLRIWG